MNTPRWPLAHRPAIERILCAIDIEQPTTGLLGFSHFIAEGFGASLSTLYVGADDTPTEQRLEQLLLDSPCPSAGARLVSGPPAPSIIKEAHTHGHDLVVLGSRQRSDLGWQFRNDVVRDVAAAGCATLTVHERDTPPVIEHILLPLDFGPATAGALEWAASFALHFTAKLQLLHVVSREQRTAHGQDRLKLHAVERELRQRGVDVAAEVIVAGSVAIGIESYNTRGEFDLVVMGASAPMADPPRLARGVIAMLRSRLSVPLLSVPDNGIGAYRPRARSLHPQQRAPMTESSG
jgi:nucleotide-binding universal stress UspA family protein